MPNPFDHLHLKRNTKGSSNELSFDVLDNARAGADAKRERPARTTGALVRPTHPFEGYHGTRGSSTLSRQDEVARRKKSRQVRTTWAAGVAVALVGVAMLASIFAGYNHYLDVRAFRAHCEALVDQLEQVDGNCMTRVDEVMADPLDASVSARDELRARMPEALEALEQTRAAAAEERSGATSEQDAMILGQIATAAEARKAMVDVTVRALQVVDASNDAATGAGAVWADVMAADALAREATEAANQASTEAAVQLARDDTQKALDAMRAAREALAAAQVTETAEAAEASGDAAAQAAGTEDGAAREGANLTQHVAYLDLRISALEHAVATSDALLEGDTVRAQSENAAYNDDDQAAAALAQDLPLSITASVEDAYEADLADLAVEYETARNRAVEADSLIREMLG